MDDTTLVIADQPAVLILAAGKGTRMKSNLIKVLHPLMGQPMLSHVINSSRYLDPKRLVVVVGHQAERVEHVFRDQDILFARQTEQLGTGHAVASARPALDGFDGHVLILSGDVPLISPQTLIDFWSAHREIGSPLSVLTVQLEDPGMYGRVIRDRDGYLEKIVEARDASSEELCVTEVNSGIYAVDAKRLFEAVARLTPANDQKEYYLTDVIADFRRQAFLVAAVMCPEQEEVLGINDRFELARATAWLKAKINQSWMRAGVSMIDPLSTYIETTVRLAPDVTLWPGTVLVGRTVVEEGVTIEPHCLLRNAVVGAGAVIRCGSAVEDVEVKAGSEIGPSAFIRGENQ
jgi:bifunctional UDP-N-acetylglucosamine pyrophosphorylase / glucosamine-1-phosphate N-acetyltransferase